MNESIKKFYQHLKVDIKLRLLITLIFGVIFISVSYNFIRSQQDPLSAQLLMKASNTQVKPADIFTLNIGIDNPNAEVLSIDSGIVFNSSLLKVVSVEIGNSNLKSILPGTNNVIDLNRAVSINTTDPTKSRVEIGLAAFDQSSSQITPGVTGSFDPAINPLILIRFQAIAVGINTLRFDYLIDKSTIDSNIIALSDNAPVDILVSPTSTQTITIASLVPSPTPTPTPKPSISPSPSATPPPLPPPPEPSPSPTPKPSASSCKYDVNGDGVVDVNDVNLVAEHTGTKEGDANYDPLYDVSNNGRVNNQDVQLVNRNRGSCQ